MTTFSDIGLVIFDCDGVLVDSEPLANGVLAAGLRAEGLEVTTDDCLRLFVGKTMPEVVTQVEEMLGRPLRADFLDDVQHETFEVFRRELRAFPGAAKAVRTVQSAGVATCVASNGALEKMAVSLGITGLTDLFDGRIFSRFQVERGKPHPDLFLHAARELGVAPERSLVVEDSDTGIRAARAAGMPVVCFDPDRRREPATVGVDLIHELASVPGLLGTV